jgi:hypothetical protein
MPIVASDIEFRLSGGAANADGNASLGGAMSSEVVSAALHAFFDRVTGAEAAAGDIEYRCLYVTNTHATLTLYQATVWLSANTPSGDTIIDIGLGTAAIGAEEQTVANESTAPAGVAFSAPASYAAGLVIGDLAPGEYKAVWLRRTVTAGAAAYNNDGAILAVQGDSGA